MRGRPPANLANRPRARRLPELAVLAVLAALLPAAAPLAAGEWRAVPDQDLSIRPGNILDFSALVEAGPAGKHGRPIATPDGHIAFEKKPARRQRFLCASQPYGVEEGFPEHETADRYARQLRLHGYNLARFHFVENVLMHGRSKDFDFDPVQLDRFHYFLAALKREGIYWMLDAMTSWNGAYGDVGPDRWADRRNVKLGVYLDPQDQQHWRQMVDQVLAVKNPYTGISPLQDPALLAVITVNEGGLNSLLNHQASPALNQEFGRWLVRQHGSVEHALKKWGVNAAGAGAVALPRREWTSSPRMADAQRFYFNMQARTHQWMSAHLRNRGYPGMISGFDNWFTVQDIATRAQLDLVAAHAYHDEPSAFVAPGSSIRQASSLPDKLAYIRDLAAGRYWNKPFAVTEFDQPFWNRYRFESGLAMGAYAALQDWDAICRHASGPIELEYGNNRGARHQYLFPYAAGADPVARAGETLAALLFLRGDVQASVHRLAIMLGNAYVFERQGGIGQLPEDIKQLALVSGIGVLWQGGGHDGKQGGAASATAMKMDLSINPDNAAPTGMARIARKIGKLLAIDPGGLGQERIDELKQAAILPKSNASNVNDGILESDTGQIHLDAKKRTLRVASTRTEAAAFELALPDGLRNLRIRESSGPALLSASSMDGAPLDSSTRILLIFAADARNSGMEFTDTEGRVLKKLGGRPVMLKTAKIRFQLRHAKPDRMRLFALKLNGERGVELPLKKSADLLDIELDTANLPAGPTTYFELAR
ncbi:glycoside hydrolase [Noviherbaspirillum sedimenti]|uniref:Glycoside hydrolase n=1 Tax=Noviherbaspirillum sedimenti TaxID=2320865 RepID=A0A3A3FY53_9BURK|nr:glycoside hydrolase [Noviherbaspirillum sedimenti]RJG01077.1 glycoside hydrolase [Noviherbaspirillum sedimenti]